MNERNQNPLENLEAVALSLILQRLMVRGRLALELDLKDLEHEVGRELPEVRSHLDVLLAIHTTGPQAPLPSPGQMQLDEASPRGLPFASGEGPKRRGRKPKEEPRLRGRDYEQDDE